MKFGSKGIEIIETKNGYTVDVSGYIKVGGRYVFKSTEQLAMIEFIGELVNGRKIAVTER